MIASGHDLGATSAADVAGRARPDHSGGAEPPPVLPPDTVVATTTAPSTEPAGPTGLSGPTATPGPPGLTVGGVARRLGVAPATLRTWARRYGMGPTSHVAGAHRRYGPEDVARLDLRRRGVEAGSSPAAGRKKRKREGASTSL